MALPLLGVDDAQDCGPAARSPQLRQDPRGRLGGWRTTAKSWFLRKESSRPSPNGRPRSAGFVIDRSTVAALIFSLLPKQHESFHFAISNLVSPGRRTPPTPASISAPSPAPHPQVGSMGTWRAGQKSQDLYLLTEEELGP